MRAAIFAIIILIPSISYASDLDSFIDGCEAIEKSIQYGLKYFKALPGDLAFEAGRCMSATVVSRRVLDGSHEYIHNKWGDKLSWGSPSELYAAADEAALFEVDISKNACIPEKEKISDMQNKIIGFYYANREKSEKQYSDNPEQFAYHALQEIYECAPNKQ